MSSVMPTHARFLNQMSCAHEAFTNTSRLTEQEWHVSVVVPSTYASDLERIHFHGARCSPVADRVELCKLDDLPVIIQILELLLCACTACSVEWA